MTENIDTLNELHENLVGHTVDIETIDKIINILKALTERLEELEEPSHIIT